MKSEKLKVFLLIAICVIALEKYFVEFLAISSNYLPVWSDEFFYYLNTYSFYINNSLEASFTFNGKGSEIIGADAHGFMYPLTHGLIAKVFGWSNLNIVITNLFFLALSAFSFSRIKFLSFFEKLFCITLIIVYPFGFLYGFTYMQETINILFAVIASKELFLVYSEQKRKKAHILAFSLIILLASLYRPTWLFGLVMLLPIATSRKELSFLTTIFFAGILLSFIYVKYFFEFVPNFFNSALNNLQSQGVVVFIKILFKHVFHNINHLLSFNKGFPYFFMKANIIFWALLFSVLALKKKEKLLQAVSLFYLINILFLLFFYDAHSWREIRYLSPLFYFSIIMIAKYFNTQLRVAFVLVTTILFFIAPIDQFKENRNTHELATFQTQQDDLKKIIHNEEVTILLNFKPQDYSSHLLKLPVRTKHNNLIKYIVPYYNVDRQAYDYVLDEDYSLTPSSKKHAK